MAPEYVKPIRYDASKLEGLLGKLPATDYQDCIGETIRWLRTDRKAS